VAAQFRLGAEGMAQGWGSRDMLLAARRGAAREAREGVRLRPQQTRDVL
jgi:hypothetical protein